MLTIKSRSYDQTFVVQTKKLKTIIHNYEMQRWWQAWNCFQLQKVSLRHNEDSFIQYLINWPELFQSFVVTNYLSFREKNDTFSRPSDISKLVLSQKPNLMWLPYLKDWLRFIMLCCIQLLWNNAYFLPYSKSENSRKTSGYTFRYTFMKTWFSSIIKKEMVKIIQNHCFWMPL